MNIAVSMCVYYYSRIFAYQIDGNTVDVFLRLNRKKEKSTQMHSSQGEIYFDNMAGIGF